MNEKTAKLLRRFAETTNANLNDLKRQWNAMDQFERRDFRVLMRQTVEVGGPEAPSAEDPEDLEDVEETEEAEGEDASSAPSTSA